MSYQIKARIILLVLGLTAVHGCAGADFDASSTALADVDHKSDALYVKSARLWRSLSIPVCWENPTARDRVAREWVRDAIANTWAGVTRVDFGGWGECATTASGLRIRIEDVSSAPHAKGLGRDLNGLPDGLSLNFDFQNWAPLCPLALSREACIRSIAVHEFGHALGFSHEQNRSDTPAECIAPRDRASSVLGDTGAGDWDADSVMNYCNLDWNNAGRLSAGDIKYSRQYYGNPSQSSARRDAINWGNGRLYFFNKGEYTRYDLNLDRADSGYPKPIIGNWGNWPGSWASGIDAAINWGNGKAYFFRGNQYLRYDMVSDRVDLSPRPISGNWPGWPQSFSRVDAIIRSTSGKAYFFRGSRYVRVSVDTREVDRGPVPIAGNWPGLWASGISYAFSKGDKAYFFKGTRYSRYDMNFDEVDYGYPLPIVGYWPGLQF